MILVAAQNILDMTLLSELRLNDPVNNISIFVCVEVLWPSQSNGVMSSTVSLPNHIFTGQA